MKMVRIFVGVITCHAALGQTAVTLEESSGAAGLSKTIAVQLSSAQPVVGFQMDVEVLSTEVQMGALLPGTVLEGTHTLDQDSIAPARVRVLVDSPTNEALSQSGTAIKIPLTFLGDVPEDEQSVRITSALFALANGTLVPTRLLPFGRLTEPVVQTTFSIHELHDGVKLRVLAFDTDQEVGTVTFSIDGVALPPVTAPPFETLWFPERPGVQQLEVTLIDNDGQSQTLPAQELEIINPATYQQWAVSMFGTTQTDLAVIGPMADPFNRGVTNLESFFFGRTATDFPPQEITVDASAGPTAPVVVFRTPVSTGEVSFVLEESNNLDDWAPVSDPDSITFSQEGLFQVYRHSGRINGHFYRLRLRKLSQ